MKELTIVIPVYNEQKTIARNILAIREQAGDANILLVDDGSRDSTWRELTLLSNELANVSCLRLSRNFGKEAAIFAGISQVTTEYCLIMDSDLQHPPRYIPEFLRIAEETGADIVEGVKQSRGKESPVYKFLAGGFYRLFRMATDVDMKSSSDFKLLNRKVMAALTEFGESHVFFRGLVEWSGFHREELPFTVDQRLGDESKFSTSKLIQLAIRSTLSFTSKPVYIPFYFAVLFLIGALVLGIQTLYNYFTGQAFSGFSTVILLLLFIGFLILFSLGIIGLYIARIYDEVKRRPRYIISERSGGKAER